MRKQIYTTLMLGFVYLFAGAAQAQTSDSFIEGVWFNEEKDGKIEVYKENGKYFGKLIWAEEPRKDIENPDESLRDRDLVGSEILKDFEYDSNEEEWNDGTIYDPKNGKTYSCFIKKENESTLYVRGYIGFSLIGRTTYWTKTE